MEKWVGKIALVTGASFGLGNHLCRLLCKAGMIVVGVARTVEMIEETSKELLGESGKLIALKCDIKSDDDINYVFDYIEKNLGGISVLVNMASAGSLESLLETDPDWFQHLIDMNVLAPVIFCKLATISMRKHNIDGFIIGVGGTASYITSWFKEYHFYSVTKFMLRSIGDGLRMEFRANNINIRVMHIGPGHILTGAQDRHENEYEEKFMRLYFYLKVRKYMKLNKIPAKLAVNIFGEKVYTNNILPVLQMQDVNDYIMLALASPQSCEVTDLIMKPTDRRNNVFESDFYERS